LNPNHPTKELAMPRVVHFQVSQRRSNEGSEILRRGVGWTFQTWDGPQDYWLIPTGPDGGTLDVADLEAPLATVISKGGKNARAKSPVLGIGHVVCCEDPEGGLFGLRQANASAR
jgi:uncharacterized protein